jgi:hypothetical protein
MNVKSWYELSSEDEVIKFKSSADKDLIWPLIKDLDEEDNKVRLMIYGKFINAFHGKVVKFNVKNPQYQTLVSNQQNETQVTSVVIERVDAFRDKVILDSLKSSLKDLKAKLQDVPRPYFTLNIKENNIPESINRRAWLSSSEQKQSVVDKKGPREIYREAVSKDIPTIIKMVEAFKGIDQREYEYWVELMKNELEKLALP